MALAQRCSVAISAQLAPPVEFGKFSERTLASGCFFNSKINRGSFLRAIHRPSQLSEEFVVARGSVSASASSSSSPTSSGKTQIPQAQVAIAFKHVLLPIIDRNPYLSDSTRQMIATTTSLAKQNGADVTVVVIDHNVGVRDPEESKDGHALQLETIRWHLSEGGCEEYKLVERVGEGSKPSAVIGEMADDLGLDLVIMSMEAIHHKHIDGNLLGEFVPCPVLMLPL